MLPSDKRCEFDSNRVGVPKKISSPSERLPFHIVSHSPEAPTEGLSSKESKFLGQNLHM
jgi:hypothetical protein